MKKNPKPGKLHTVNEDEKYLLGINLITGDKIIYTRPIQTQAQIEVLCISEKFTKYEKFYKIIMEGEKIQKWSVFENLVEYVQNGKQSEQIFITLEKIFLECEQFVPIMGEGLYHYLQKCIQDPSLCTQNSMNIIFRITITTLMNTSYQSEHSLQDWIDILRVFFKVKGIQNQKLKMQKLKQFINGSFSINTLPKRRKVAVAMIQALILQSKEVEAQAHSKISFFYGDLDPSVRLMFCSIIEKMMEKQPNQQNNIELWKIILEYFHKDQDQRVRQKAIKIIGEIYWESNFDVVYNLIDSQDDVEIFIGEIGTLIHTFHMHFELNEKSKTKMISFLNRILKKNYQKYLPYIFKSYEQFCSLLTDQVFFKNVKISSLKNDSEWLLSELIRLYNRIDHLQCKQSIKIHIIKGIKLCFYEVKLKNEEFDELMEMFELEQPEDSLIFTNIFEKMVENSWWRSVSKIIDGIGRLTFNLGIYEKLSFSLINLFGNCPYFLLQPTFRAIMHMVLSERKTFQLFHKIKQKYLNSKSWMHRRNYILLYFHIKAYSSFEFSKILPVIVYKNIPFQKSSQVRMQFLRSLKITYPQIDPLSIIERASMRQTVNRLIEDSDVFVKKLALETQEVIKFVDSDTERMNFLMVRNKERVQTEMNIEQLASQSKKYIKTEKLVDLKNNMRKKPHSGFLGGIAQAKTTLNLRPKYLVNEKEKDKSRKEIMNPNNKSLNRAESQKIGIEKKTIFKKTPKFI